MRASVLAVGVTMMMALTSAADAACRRSDLSGLWLTYSAGNTVCSVIVLKSGVLLRSECYVGRLYVGQFTGRLRLSPSCTVFANAAQSINERRIRFKLKGTMNENHTVITGSTRSVDGVFPFKAVKR